MKYIKKFNESNFDSEIPLPTDPDVIRYMLLQHTDTTDNCFDRIEIEPDGTINVIEGSLKIMSGNSEGLIPLKFGFVKDNFSIYSKSGITSLKGSPHTCYNFEVSFLKITSLEGGPTTVFGLYDVEGTDITSLVGSPEEVGGLFDCSSNPNLKTLEGAPKRVGHSFLCSSTSITNLIGGPEEVGWDFVCRKCDKLTSLEGAPKKARALLFDAYAYLWDPRPLKGCEIEHLNAGLQQRGSPLQSLKNIFHCNALTTEEATKYFLDSLDYNYIRGSSLYRMINLFRFSEAFREIGYKPAPEQLEELQKYWTFADDDNRTIENVRSLY